MKNLLSLVLLFALAAGSSFAKSNSPSSTQGDQQKSLTKYLYSHLKSISIHGDTAVLKSDGAVYQFYQSGKKKPQYSSTIVLRRSGDSFTCDYGVH